MKAEGTRRALHWNWLNLQHHLYNNHTETRRLNKIFIFTITTPLIFFNTVQRLAINSDDGKLKTRTCPPSSDDDNLKKKNPPQHWGGWRRNWNVTFSVYQDRTGCKLMVQKNKTPPAQCVAAVTAIKIKTKSLHYLRFSPESTVFQTNANISII